VKGFDEDGFGEKLLRNIKEACCLEGMKM